MRYQGAFRNRRPARVELLEDRRLLATIAGRQVFYNQSVFDGHDAAISAADDAAIATNKAPYLATVQFQIEPLTDNATYDTNPRVYGDKIVWEGRGGTDGGTDEEVFYYDGSTVMQLTENSDLDRNVQISALGLAWQRGNGTGTEIVYSDGVTETPLTSNSVLDTNHTLTDTRLSWEQKEPDPSTARQIMTWTGAARRRI